MNFNNAYEVLDYLANKSGMFEMIKAEFLAKDGKIQNQQNQINELTTQLGDMMLGGGI